MRDPPPTMPYDLPSPPPTPKPRTPPDRPPGVLPENYIGTNIREHNGTRCALCVEEAALVVPQLLLPQTRVNKSGSFMCIHVYTPRRGAVFYWNENGSKFARRVDGSAEFKTPRGFVKRYDVGTYVQPEGMPYLPAHLFESDALRSRSESYFEGLFQLYHPLAATANEGLPKRDQVR